MRQRTVTEPVWALVDAIAEHQRLNRLTDSQIARKLSVPRTSWCSAKNRWYRPGLPFVQKAARSPEFRELAERILLPPPSDEVATQDDENGAA